MFIDYGDLRFNSSGGEQCVSRLYCAPLELGLVCDRCSYKHSAPPELNGLVEALPRRVSVVAFAADFTTGTQSSTEHAQSKTNQDTGFRGWSWLPLGLE
jgi:hypothetical protein